MFVTHSMFALASSATVAIAARAPGVPRRGSSRVLRTPSRGKLIVRRVTQPEEPGPDDFVTFNSIVGAGAWDVVQAQVREAAVDGKLTAGVLGAAYSVYEKCKEIEEKPEVLKTLENVILLLTQTLQQLDATPAVRLIDELMTYDPFADGDKVRAVVDDAIAGGDVKPDDIKGSLQMMLDGMAEQDEAWEKHVAQASQTSSKEEFEQLLGARFGADGGAAQADPTQSHLRRQVSELVRVGACVRTQSRVIRVVVVACITGRPGRPIIFFGNIIPS